MERRWSIREYREGDEEGILELCKAVYPSRTYDREQWMRWWRWLYKENPVGLARIWVAEDNGKIVGHYPLVFMMLKAGNQLAKASQNIDQMTHPDYRYQGIASRLGKMALREAEREGVHITIGFANQASYVVDVRAGWFDVAARQIVFKALSWGNTLKLRISNRLLSKLGAIGGNILSSVFYRSEKAPALEGVRITQISSFDERIDELWARVSNNYPVMVVRNKEYLNWRYAAIPDVHYSIYIAEKEGDIHGYLVLRCVQQGGTKTGIIFDILATSQQIYQCLISQAMAQCELEKADTIYGLMIADKTVSTAFRKNGFLSFPFLKDGRFIVYSSSPHVSKEFLAEPKNWFVQIGDSDQI
jgi:GNAT superfamily N-acetyltransferase